MWNALDVVPNSANVIAHVELSIIPTISKIKFIASFELILLREAIIKMILKVYVHVHITRIDDINAANRKFR